jgi:hypothetical protein
MDLGIGLGLLVGAFFLLRLLFPGVVRYLLQHDSSGEVLLALLFGVLTVGILLCAAVKKVTELVIRNATGIRRR